MNTKRRPSDMSSEFTPPAGAARNVPIIVLISLGVFFAFGAALSAQEGGQTIGLGTADDFAVLTGESFTNTGPTTITGDIGIHPRTSVTGFDSVTLEGELHETDAVAEQAKVDLVTAYNDAAGRSVTETIPTELAGQTLTSGVYDSAPGTFGITGTLTLDAEGDPNAVFVFQMESTLITGSGSSVELINGADACNVFWQVGSSATLGTNSSFSGNILALTSITLTTGATVEGRVLARDGSVTLDTNTITGAICATPVTTTTAAPTTTPRPRLPPLRPRPPRRPRLLQTPRPPPWPRLWVGSTAVGVRPQAIRTSSCSSAASLYSRSRPERSRSADGSKTAGRAS